MADIRTKYVSPAINQTAFNCPHCGVLAKQTWYTLAADALARDQVPRLITEEAAGKASLAGIKKEDQAAARQLLDRLATARPFVRYDSKYREHEVENLWIARCFNCDNVSIWVYDSMVYPSPLEAPLPNTDLSPDILRDYNEAGSILSASPRGAAALLRLAIQKLAKELGGNGKDINEDIGHLVANGLDKRVQQALDVVRVIGNNAVHPGVIDLRDDRPTAEKLFDLVNIIADIMISQPKHLQKMFDNLPEGARKAIEKRDGSAPS